MSKDHPKTFVGHCGTRRVVVLHGPGEERNFYELDPHNELINHSPDGFAWGYSGSGPLQLAFAMLFDLYGRETAFACYQAFCHEVIDAQPQHISFRLEEIDIEAWVDKHMEGVRWRKE